MPYTPTNWENDQAPALSGPNLDKLENAMQAIYQMVEDLIASGSGGFSIGDLKLTAKNVANLTGEQIIEAGWLLCNGAAVNRLTYQELYAAIGVHYGSGDGSTTFNLPDLRGVVPVARAEGDADFGTTGQGGGAKTVTLTIAQMPAHGHPRTGGAFHGSFELGGGGYGGAGTQGNAGPGYAANGLGGSLPSDGGGQAHPNLQPYRVIGAVLIRATP